MKARNSTLQILIEAILNAAEDEVSDIVKKIRTCDSLDAVAESILKQGYGNEGAEDESRLDDDYTTDLPVEGERDLARKMGELRLENGSVRFIGGTSHLIHMETPIVQPEHEAEDWATAGVDPIITWSDVTENSDDIMHLLNMYWNWHYPYFVTLSRNLFFRDFLKGKPRGNVYKTTYCSSLLVNAMLALGCHFTDADCAYATPGDNWTKGDHFFAEAKRLIVENDEYEKPRLTTVQALALMSVREAGCGREAKGWVYSGMSFRMAQDLGLNLDLGGISTDNEHMDEHEVDARRVTFWGCFLFDKCWSNYLGRLPQLPKNSYSVPKYDVFPNEEAEDWCPYTNSGFDQSQKQPARTRTVGLQLSKLCEISSDLLLFFYHPNHIGRSNGKSVELKKLSELHRRLEDWQKTAKRDIIHGVKHLEEIAEDWLCGRRTLSILSVLARKWNVQLPEEAFHVLQRTDEKWGGFNPSDVPSPNSTFTASPSPSAYGATSPIAKSEQYSPASNHANPNSTTRIQGIPGASGSPDMISSLAGTNFQPVVQGPQRAMNNPAIMGNSGPLSVDGLNGTSWRQPPARRSVPTYNQSYARMPNNSSMESSQASSRTSTTATPNSVYAMDGQEWCIKDSVNWQSSFDTWNMANPTTSVAAAAAAAAAVEDSGLSDPSVFLFARNTTAAAAANDSGQSPPTGDFNFDALEGLSGNIGSWDLTGLD
ncbi:hypothetical protein DL762_005062 [Monosporascus cannonballus]|uniref:Xylanolytic transcriptional activator regulatory domain-containing protein n=1 Tax=Monosporascus cannonballus TaxID=155416 RepID=A0ABY0H5Z9_9PEZI|nr:hypothetical protein DL762_005062 [Monosporascus cannonballus]RYO96112.1 hypothetical protein DL763_003402 [Monosporascus cannonballus]